MSRSGLPLALLSVGALAVAGLARFGSRSILSIGNTVTIPAGTPLWHATQASFPGIPTSPKGDRPTWFGLGRTETLWYATSSWREGASPRLIESVTTRPLVLPNVAGGYGAFAMSVGANEVTPQALTAALRARGDCGWAIASRTLGLTSESAIALVDPAGCGVRFVGSEEIR